MVLESIFVQISHVAFGMVVWMFEVLIQKSYLCYTT